MEKRYQIVFCGEISDQVSRAEARENIAKLFKGNPRPLPDMFTGKRHILKSNLDQQTAAQYLNRLHRAGLICRLDEVAEEDKEPVELALKCEMIICPNCREEQVKHAECRKCGILFGKWERRSVSNPPPLLPVHGKPPTKETNWAMAEWGKLVVLMPLLVMLGFCIWKIEGWDQLHYPEGALVTSSPQQTKLDTPKYFKKDGVSYTSSDQYRLRARLLKKDGFILDLFRISDPVVYLGWGPMSDEVILEMVEIESDLIRYKQQPPVPVDMLMSCFLRSTIMPASGAVEHALKNLRVGEVVELGGYLLSGG